MPAVSCPRCAREIAAADVSLEQALGRCTTCNIVFPCGQTASAPYSKPQVPMPRSITAGLDVDGFTLTRRWFGPAAFGLLFFVILWDGFLVVWYSIAFKANAPMLMKLFPLLHVAVGLFLTYVTAAMFANSTVIKMAQGMLTVKHGPLPWPGNKALPRAEVAQLFCQEKVSHGDNGTSYSYTVQAAMKDSRRVELVSGLDSPEQALFIEQRLEKALSIQDRPVAGEMRPPI